MTSASRGRGIPPRGADAETPISKYLAQLERRKTVYVSPSANAGRSGSDLLSPEEFGINRTRFGFGGQSSTKPVGTEIPPRVPSGPSATLLSRSLCPVAHRPCKVPQSLPVTAHSFDI